MTAGETDQMTEVIIEQLVASDEGWRMIPRDMARAHPQASVHSLVFALTAAGSAIETMYQPHSPTYPAAQRAFRLAALVGADLFGAQIRGVALDDLASLEHYWRLYDDYFLTQ